ncbi:MAG: response regulator transcription factor [Actinomycetota bacterium]
MPTALIADDDPTVARVLGEYLRRADITPVMASNGAEALAAVRDSSIDVAVLDVMMGPPDGLQVCRLLRADPLTVNLPVILLTALGDELDRIAGFEIGADDYVTKPFSPREVSLRVQALLRRRAELVVADAMSLVSGDLDINLPARTVMRAGKLIPTTSREFDLLTFFVRHPGQMFSREVLMHRVWGWSFGDESTVTVHVRRLREKVEDDPSVPSRLVTVWGLGYRWDGDSG